MNLLSIQFRKSSFFNSSNRFNLHFIETVNKKKHNAWGPQVAIVVFEAEKEEK